MYVTMPHSNAEGSFPRERLEAVGQIVRTVTWFRSILKPDQWPFCEEFTEDRFALTFFSADGIDQIRIASDRNALRISNNLGSGYAGVAGIGISQDPWDEGNLAKIIILDSEGEEIYTQGQINYLKNGNEQSVVAIGETSNKFFVYIGKEIYGLDKELLYHTEGDQVFTPVILDLLNDLVTEEIFTL